MLLIRCWARSAWAKCVGEVSVAVHWLNEIWRQVLIQKLGLGRLNGVALFMVIVRVGGSSVCRSLSFFLLSLLGSYIFRGFLFYECFPHMTIFHANFNDCFSVSLVSLPVCYFSVVFRGWRGFVNEGKINKKPL